MISLAPSVLGRIGVSREWDLNIGPYTRRPYGVDSALSFKVASLCVTLVKYFQFQVLNITTI